MTYASAEAFKSRFKVDSTEKMEDKQQAEKSNDPLNPIQDTQEKQYSADNNDPEISTSNTGEKRDCEEANDNDEVKDKDDKQQGEECDVDDESDWNGSFSSNSSIFWDNSFGGGIIMTDHLLFQDYSGSEFESDTEFEAVDHWLDDMMSGIENDGEAHEESEDGDDYRDVIEAVFGNYNFGLPSSPGNIANAEQ